jgi:hypothetical protein
VISEARELAVLAEFELEENPLSKLSIALEIPIAMAIMSQARMRNRVPTTTGAMQSQGSISGRCSSRDFSASANPTAAIKSSSKGQLKRPPLIPERGGRLTSGMCSSIQGRRNPMKASEAPARMTGSGKRPLVGRRGRSSVSGC